MCYSRLNTHTHTHTLIHTRIQLSCRIHNTNPNPMFPEHPLSEEMAAEPGEEDGEFRGWLPRAVPAVHVGGASRRLTQFDSTSRVV